MSDQPLEFIVVTIKVLRPTAEDPKGYLGAVSLHPPLPGETHKRGSDLADGACTERTLQQITDDVRAIMEGFDKAFARDAT